MGLASALSTALTGLTAAETTIDVVGNNLANSNTVGFKASEANFATQFLQTRSLGSSPSSNSGGTNPRQTGLGTMVADITPNFSQGTIEISASPTDLAIQGEGFFIVQGGQGEQLYTRNGIFKMNANNEMVTITGNRLLGYGIDDQFNIQTTLLQPIEIPLGAAAVAQATENVRLEGTLSPTGDVADTAEIIETAILGDAQWTAPAAGTRGILSGTPASSTLGAGAAGGAMTAGNQYEYRIVFANDDPTSLLPDISNTEGVPSDAATALSVVLQAGENSVNLTNIPVAPKIPHPIIPAPPAPLNPPIDSYTSRRIYRRDVNAATPQYQFVGAIADNTATIYTDSLSEIDAADTNLATYATLNTDTLNGAYSYFVTFADASGGPGNGRESRPAPMIGPLTANSGRIQLRELPVDANGQWGYRRIYRNLSTDDSAFHFVGEIASATSIDQTFTDNASDDTIVANAQIDREGEPITDSSLLTDILLRDQATYNQVFQEGTLEFTGRKGGRTLYPKTMTITATSTVQELYNFMEEALGIREVPGPDPLNPIPDGDPSATTVNPGGSVTSLAGNTGRIRLVGNNGVANALDIGLSGLQLTTALGVVDTVTLPFSSSQSAVGESAVTNFVAYDSLGIPLSVQLTAVMESRNSTSTTYRWFADSSDNDPLTGVEIGVGTGLLTFDGEGNFVSATETAVSIERRNVSAASPLEFDLDFSQISGLSTDQSTMAVSRQDGSGAGVLTSFIVGEDGTIRGVFSNGVTRDLGQIRLARFGNPSGLEQKGENLFASGVNSGLPVQANPGQQGIGNIIAGAQELSNTDIGSNLIDLILASTMYRGNTRVITTAQQMLDELLALRR